MKIGKREVETETEFLKSVRKLPSLPSCLLVGPSFSHFHPQSLPQSILSALSLPDTKDESLNSSHFQLLPPGLDLVGLFIPKAKDAAELKEKMRTDVSLKSSLRLLEASNEGVYVVLTLNESGVKLYKVQKVKKLPHLLLIQFRKNVFFFLNSFFLLFQTESELYVGRSGD